MSDYSYIASENIGGNTKSKKLEKGLRRLLVIAGVILAAELIWLFVISPIIPFSTIEVNGFDGLSRAEILGAAGIDETSSFMSTNVREVQQRISSHILVESANVSKRFPDRLTISLSPRRAAAVTLAHIDGRQLPLYIDTNGVFFKVGRTMANTNILPVISGLENPQMYMQLPASLVPLVENISLLAEGSPELLASISEIRIEQKPWGGYDLVLYPVHSPVRVRVQNNLTEDILRYMLLMLNVFEHNSQNPAEVDFRSGVGSFIIEGQS